jgi:hypothetical protein
MQEGNMTRDEKIDAVEAAIEMIEEALSMLSDIASSDANFDAYVYRQLSESLNNQNPYNQSLQSYLERLYESDEDYG